MQLNDKAIAVYVGYVTIFIYGIEYGINDRITWRYFDESRMHCSMVHYSDHGDYFKANGRRIRLDQCMKLL